LKRHLKKISSSFDIIHVHSYHALPALYASQTKKNNLLVFTPHYLGKGQTFFRNLLHIPYKFIAKKIFKESEKVICVSKYEKNMIIKNFQIEEEKISIIPNGVNVCELSKFTWAPNLKNPKIIYSGRLEKTQKNVDKLIRSFKKIVENNIDAEFVIIGDGPYKTGMKNLIKKLNLEERVKVKNWLPRIDYLKELASSNVFVLPSDYECYGIAAAEAIIMGIPTVVADSTALSEFVENGLALGINTPITPQEIAKSIQKALTTPKVSITSTQDKILSWNDIVERLERLYLEIKIN
jgi:glycosyltransferase involved in cell wall biosynthesis